MTAPPDFDRVARIYRWAEYVALGPLLQRIRTHFLPELSGRRKALILGDGDGRFTAAFSSRFPDTPILAVDTSAAMLRLLRKRYRQLPQLHSRHVRTLQASALDIQPDRGTDLVATHFLLDCLTQSDVERLIRTYAATLQPGALWLVSDFRIPSGPLRPFARLYIRALYFAFRILTGLLVHSLPDPAIAFRGAGFRLRARHTRLGGMLYTELWSNDAQSKD